MWRTKDGVRVVDRYNSHLHESVEAILPEALARVEVTGRGFVVQQIDFDRVVGQSVCVETSSSDEVVYAKRPKRFGSSRFVKNRQAEPCSSVVLILKIADGEENAMVLITAFIGQLSEPEPWDRNATAKSLEFWSNHALIWGSEPIITGTETSECPWLINRAE
jgi:hypothetical protein